MVSLLFCCGVTICSSSVPSSYLAGAYLVVRFLFFFQFSRTSMFGLLLSDALRLRLIGFALMSSFVNRYVRTFLDLIRFVRVSSAYTRTLQVRGRRVGCEAPHIGSIPRIPRVDLAPA